MIWRARNNPHCTGVSGSVLLEARDETEARSLAYSILLGRAESLFPGCWGQRRRFSIIETVEPYDDGPLFELKLPVVFVDHSDESEKHEFIQT